jgi:MFS transporter, DHA1 family, tetracycline resistance protein
LTRSSRAPLLIIFITVFIDLLGFGIVLPVLPRYATHFRMSDMQLGLLMASFSAMQFLFAPVWGRISDRVGRRPILMLGLFGSALFYSLFGYATSLGFEGQLLGLGVVPWLYICRIGAGIAGATIPTAQAYIADVTGPEQRAKGMALIGAAFGIGFCFGPLLGAIFVPPETGPETPAVVSASDSAPETNPAPESSAAESSAGELKAELPPSAIPGYLAGGLSTLALLSAIFLLPESLQPGSRAEARHWLDLTSLKAAVARPSIGFTLLVIFLTTVAFGQFETTLSLLTKKRGIPVDKNYLLFSYIGLVLALSQGFLIRRFLPKLGELLMGRLGTVLMTLGLIGIGFAALDQTLSLGYLRIVIAVAVVGFAAVTPSLQSLLSRHSAATQQGGILGLGQSISALARIVGPAIGMPLHGINIALPYWVAGGIMAFCILLSLGLKQPHDVPEH